LGPISQECQQWIHVCNTSNDRRFVWRSPDVGSEHVSKWQRRVWCLRMQRISESRTPKYRLWDLQEDAQACPHHQAYVAGGIFSSPFVPGEIPSVEDRIILPACCGWKLPRSESTRATCARCVTYIVISKPSSVFSMVRDRFQ